MLTRSPGLRLAWPLISTVSDSPEGFEVIEQIGRAGRDRLLAFHICDWLVPTTDILTGRGMMGDGVIEIQRLRGAVEAAGFSGACEVEVLSTAWWKRPMDEVLSTVIERYRTVC